MSHFNSSKSGFIAFITMNSARTIDSLLLVVGRQYTKYNRF